ncbi:hypothetical protein HYU21_02500, partial [Candidatus Woesearchaeota archaeon]|nr:hypothetical protein [Candidatus Woesearchaeota archaeon]
LFDATDNQRAVPDKEISINDIIAVEGERTCLENVPSSATIVPTVADQIAS